MEKHILSKSSFMSGLQCEKQLYLYKNGRRLGISPEEHDASTQAIFKSGTDVGILAQKLFPNGVDASPDSPYEYQKSVELTRELIAKGEIVIYEAAFQFDKVMAAMDILVKHEDGWRAYEVKSSTSVKDQYRMDAAIQHYVITNSGIPLKDISIVYINNQYEKNGELDINQLFTMESVLEDALSHQPEIPNQIRRLKTVLESKEIPEKDIGPHCSDPYGCNFAGHCWKHIPAYSVFDISNLGKDKKWELCNMGILQFQDIPKDYEMGDNQWMQVQSELNQETVINQEGISSFLDGLNYPLYYLDFETFGNAVPILDKSRPYQQLLFQYSLHIQQEPHGDCEHREYLAEVNGPDPRIGFVKQLIAECGSEGDVLVYSIGFERGKLKNLIELYPEYSEELSAIIARMKDLIIPFQKRHYYVPEMRGSYSIKAVLPALVPDLTYKDLAIQEGQTASNTFAAMMAGTFQGDIAQVRKDLLEYCKLDTWAMVKILEKLLHC
jgi:hypothetical protein